MLGTTAQLTMCLVLFVVLVGGQAVEEQVAIWVVAPYATEILLLGAAGMPTSIHIPVGSRSPYGPSHVSVQKK